jgi:glycosyltransferase involved in cell wall biosynthesis
LAASAESESRQAVPLVEIAIPVYNEEEVIEASVRRLRAYLDESFPFSASIVMVDNASEDRTWEVITKLCDELPGVHGIHLDQKGKGHAIRAAWTASRSPVVAYMDADLSTHLDGLLPLVAPLLSGHSEVAIGSRIAPGARVLRGAKREFISRGYNLMLRGVLRCRFSDAQCGFKAMRRDAVEPLLELIEDEHWFFDTELLIQAQRSGLRIHEVSVDWIDDPDSRVNIGGAMRDDLQGVWRLARQRPDGNKVPTAKSPLASASTFKDHGELARYTSVGIISSFAYLALFFLLRNTLGMFAANVVAAAATSIGNTLAHVLFTFRTKQIGLARRAIAVGAISFAVGIGLTTAALAAAFAVGSTSPTAEGVAIIAGIAAASGVRFILLREWVFRNHIRAVRSTAQYSEPVDSGQAPSQAA